MSEDTGTTTEVADLGIRAFQSASALRSNEWHGDKPWTLSDWMTATMGELGEAANIVKKMNRHRDGLETDRDPSAMALASQLALELADTLAYLVLVADAANVDLAKATVAKFNQVSARQGWEHHFLPPLTDPTTQETP